MQDTAAPLPERIGSYRILSLLGEGSMGRVYLAREERPEREVALKVLRLASMTGPMQTRFQREVEMLARLEHPGIARLYAAGSATSEAGTVPYLAMEYVRGSDLRSYAASAALELPARLQLLAEVCRAVHYAHTRGVIHRDLKPGNIFVDERGQPKVLDFGIAHMSDAGEETQMTVAGQVLGTLPYMSPEQLSGGRAPIDPRTDVYALGAIAYELIGGQLPYPGMSRSSLMQALELVRSHTPERLSKLAPEARGDVETVVNKAMAQDPAQRYGSAAELALDLERIVAHQPVEARPPTVAYVASLFVRRHKALAAAAGLIAVALVVATAVSLSYAAIAQRRLAENQSITQFLEDVLTSADPDSARGKDLTVRELLDAARLSLDSDRGLPPSVATSLARTLGISYMSLGKNTEAVALLERALQGARSAEGADSLAARRTAVNYAAALNEFGRYPEAEKLLAEVLARWPAPSAEPLERAQHLALRSELAQARANQGRLAEAVPQLEQVYAEAERALGPTHAETLTAQYLLANAYLNQAELKKALPLARSLVERRTQANGPDHPRTLYARMLPASILFNLEQYADAAAAYRALFEDQSRVLGADQSGTLLTALNLCTVLASTKDPAVYAEAAQHCRYALDRYVAQLEPGHNKIVAALSTLSYIEQLRGNSAEAERLIRDAMARVEQASSKGHAQNTSLRNSLANLLMEQGRLQESLVEFERAVADTRATLGQDHPFAAMYALNQAECLRRLGRHAQAVALLEPNLKLLLDKFGPEHPRVKKGQDRLARARAGDPTPVP